MSWELDKFVYDLIIQRTIDAPKKLLELLSLWPSNLYNWEVVVELIQQKLKDQADKKDDGNLTETQAILKKKNLETLTKILSI